MGPCLYKNRKPIRESPSKEKNIVSEYYSIVETYFRKVNSETGNVARKIPKKADLGKRQVTSYPDLLSLHCKGINIWLRDSACKL